jgi:outer membrane protein assembly factor BamB
MRFPPTLLAALLVLAARGPATAQVAAVPPPSEAALDVLNLKTEWTTAVPLAGRFDAVELIQVADGNQIFVQTKGGLLLALDAKTGSQQWQLKFDAANAPVFPVAVNDRLLVAVNLVSMYCVHRYTGLVEFKFRLPLVPSAGPTIDKDTAYLTLNGQRMTAYALPDPVTMPERRANANAGVGSLAGAVDFRIKNPADVVATRYPGTVRKSANVVDRFEESKVTVSADTQLTGGALATQRAPSLSVLPSVRPPYNVFDDRGKYVVRSESLSTVHSMRQPYSLTDPTGAAIQRTPSIASIPPSLAALYEQTNLLARPLEPKARWVVGSTVRLTHPPLTTNFRVWLLSDSQIVQVYLKEDKSLQLTARMPNHPAAEPGQADDIGYIPLIDGNLMAFDLTGGGGGVAKVVWRANVGGAMNRKPLLTKDAVYQGGDTSGVARIDRKTGEVLWRTDDTADTVLAVNDEIVYVRDKQGLLRAYDRNRVTDPATRRAVQLGVLSLGGFPVTTENEFTDRLYMASATGLLICLRDKSPKYAAPLVVGPPLHAPAPALGKKPDPNAPPMPNTPAEPKN